MDKLSNKPTNQEATIKDEVTLDGMHILLTPKQTNVQSYPQVVSVTANSARQDSNVHDTIPTKSDIACSLTDEVPGFRHVHYRVFESVTT